MPMSYGVGLSYRRTDRLSTSLDIYRTEWDGFTYTDSNGDKKSFLTGEDTNVTPTVQVRAGIEYLIIKTNYVIPLRSGLFYDPAPAVDNPEDFYGFSLVQELFLKKLPLMPHISTDLEMMSVIICFKILVFHKILMNICCIFLPSYIFNNENLKHKIVRANYDYMQN